MGTFPVDAMARHVAIVAFVDDGLSAWHMLRGGLMVLFGIALAYSVCRLCRMTRSVMRHRRDRCSACGYLLVHSAEIIRCPECGVEKGLFATRSHLASVVRNSFVSLVAVMGLLVSIWPKYLVQASPDAVIAAVYLAGCEESVLVEEIEHRAYRGFSPLAVRMISRYAWRRGDFEFQITTPDEWVNGIPVLGSICLDAWPLDSLGGVFSVRMMCGSAEESSEWVLSMCGFEPGAFEDPRVAIPGIECGAGEVECRVLIDWINTGWEAQTIVEVASVLRRPTCVDPATLAVRWEEDCESIVLGAELNLRSPYSIWFTLQDVSAIAEAEAPCMMMAFEVTLLIDDHVIGHGQLRYFRHQPDMVNWARLPMPIEFARGGYQLSSDDLINPSRLRVTLRPSEAMAVRSGMRCHYVHCHYEIPVVIRHRVNEWERLQW